MQPLTDSANSKDWIEATKDMNISVFIGYVVDTITLGYVESSWDETIEEVLQENTVLWDRLAEV